MRLSSLQILVLCYGALLGGGGRTHAPERSADRIRRERNDPVL